MWRLTLPQLTTANRWFPLFAGNVMVFLCVSLYATLLRGLDLSSLLGISATQTNEDLYTGLLALNGNTEEDKVVGALLYQLIEKGMIASMITSGHLSSISFWTSKFIIFPILNLIGIVCVIPCFYLLVKQYWWNETVTSGQVSWALPLNVLSLLICGGLPTLMAATLMILGCSIMQFTVRQRSEYATKMRI
jgi:hypothetical protein